jgi:hypothetical protein
LAALPGIDLPPVEDRELKRHGHQKEGTSLVSIENRQTAWFGKKKIATIWENRPLYIPSIAICGTSLDSHTGNSAKKSVWAAAAA